MQPQRKGRWMQTYTKRQYWPIDPRPDEVDITDIAHALAYLCRYTGHCGRYYSVAEHSVLVSHMVPPEYAFCGLMHDATEAYLGDVARPLKSSMPNYQEFEELNWLCISQRYDLPLVIPQCVHDADNGILKAERIELGMESEFDWHLSGPTPNVPIVGMLPAQAECAFMHRFNELYAGDPA